MEDVHVKEDSEGEPEKGTGVGGGEEPGKNVAPQQPQCLICMVR